MISQEVGITVWLSFLGMLRSREVLGLAQGPLAGRGGGLRASRGGPKGLDTNADDLLGPEQPAGLPRAPASISHPLHHVSWSEVVGTRCNGTRRAKHRVWLPLREHPATEIRPPREGRGVPAGWRCSEWAGPRPLAGPTPHAGRYGRGVFSTLGWHVDFSTSFSLPRWGRAGDQES